MKILEILKSEPDETVQKMIEVHKAEHDVKVVKLYEGADYDSLVDDIFEADKVVSWW
ncbi:MAG: hypothetical protein GXO65_07665 [Euryarchaeota archaeon]|nr:hypothetical protein [Euryarchaeota archaeon]